MQTIQKRKTEVHGMRWVKGKILEVITVCCTQGHKGVLYTINFDDREVSVLNPADESEIIMPELTKTRALEELHDFDQNGGTRRDLEILDAMALAKAKPLLKVSEEEAARLAAEARATENHSRRLFAEAEVREAARADRARGVRLPAQL